MIKNKSININLIAILFLAGCLFISMALPIDAAITQQKNALTNLDDAFTTVVENISPAVVSITGERNIKQPATQPNEIPDDFFKDFPFPLPLPEQAPAPRQQPESMGTGVIVRQDGYILTNDHVVGGADKVVVTLKNGKTYDGKVFRDQKGDLALVKIEAKGLPEAKLGDSDKVKAGSIVIAIGSPFGYDQTVTMGVISGIGRQAGVSDGKEARYYPNLLQTDASINPGNSGGPLININGEVIGINTLIRSNYAGGNIGIGFAIPSNTAKFIMDQLISTGKVTRGYLGIQPDNLTPDQKDIYGTEYGSLVRTVEQDSPADKGGIQVEDVIVEINGKKIENEVQLRDAIAAAKPGTEIPIKVIRDKNLKELKIKLTEDPMTAASNGNQSVESSNKLGIDVSAITPELATKYQIDPKSTGILITDVLQGSNAAKVGITAGLVIIKANNKDIRSISDMEAATKSLKSGDTLRLVIKTKERTALVSYKLN